MRQVQTFLLIIACSIPLAANGAPPLNGLTQAESRGGWQLLFDGKSTKGWRNYRQETLSDGWVVDDGALRRAARRAGDIVTVQQYDNFEMSLEYQISKGGNSGIMFHVTEDNRAPWHSGPEIQVQDNIDGHDPQKSGWLYQLYKPVKPAWAKRFEAQVGFKSPEVVDATKPPGQWNHVYLRITKQQCEVVVNGVGYYYFRLGDDEWNERVAKSKFSRYENFGKAGKGHICLQDHGNPVAYRNIKLRKLPADGVAPDNVDGELPIKTEVAFPNLEWEGWKGVDDRGKIHPLRPLVLTHAGDGSNRVFTAVQSGLIHTFPGNQSAKRAKLILDIRDRVMDWRSEDEEGMLGMALHPNFKENGQIYVYYSSASDLRTSIVSRFTLPKDGSPIDADDEQLVMKIPQPFANHNGGCIAFGPDGYLYIGLGDGGGRNDPMHHGQNLSTWMGCILRIDVDKKEGDRAYAIPADNPFVKRQGARPEIYAYGFRNIWRMAFDRQDGRLWVGDVGQDLWEEINIVKPGGNYGWSTREARYGFNNVPAKIQDEPLDPVWEYDHRIGKSITGGFVYRGEAIPALQGCYLYADYVSGKIWALKYDTKANRVSKLWRIPTNGIPVISFGEDERGEVYYTIQTASGKSIYRFVEK
ncbi:MAG: PQQ-dependent sugar dehydrogenase [Pirellulaceae bacterium]|nr:PQQ-dependent sugar dehydrogenase [Pirellulaceae bacterium]MDP7016450.1 PQQ-dependent sugar dehydrogenase [Pirellulaceae bacterium]